MEVNTSRSYHNINIEKQREKIMKKLREVKDVLDQLYITTMQQKGLA
jgi:hypothetical protein